MKYEMIFGDERLADKFTNENSVFIVCRGHGVYFEFESGSAGVNYVANSCTIGDSFYMRRIIKEPKRWTWEDKREGRLPEVGSLIVNVETGDQFSFVGINAGSNRWACKDACDGLLYFFKSHEMSPIETPEEKAARLREEWCNEAGLVCSLGMTTLTRIYDAMLSGDLPVPVKG